MPPDAVPEINELPCPKGRELVEVTTSTDNGAMPSRQNVVPIKGVTPPKSDPPKRRRRKKGEPPYLQAEELERLFKAIDSPRDRAIFRLAYHAGLRASEVGILHLRDYDPRTERLYVHRLKGSNSGEHHLCREETRALKAWLKIRGSEPGVIFASRKHSPISRQMLDVLMKEYGAAAELPKNLRHFHVLKHTCATHLLSRGFHVEQVQDWIGHANIQNTMIYAHITNGRRDEMARGLRDWK
jgi:type 1 fimbriae regulatory protein FimB